MAIPAIPGVPTVQRTGGDDRGARGGASGAAGGAGAAGDPAGGERAPGGRLRGAAARAGQGHPQAPQQRGRRDRGGGGQVLRGHQGRDPAAAESQAADDGGHRAGVGGRLLPVLGLDLRGRLRGADLHPRDGPRDRSCAARASRPARRCSSPSWARSSAPARSARTRSPRPAWDSPGRSSERSAPRPAWRSARPTNSDLLRALAYVGFFLNLFNLLPVVPLDGGRAMAAMSPWMWFVGFGVLVALLLVAYNPILLIIVAFAGMETYRRWKLRKSGSLEQAAYYRVAPRHRLLVGAVYIGLIVLLAFGMHGPTSSSTAGPQLPLDLAAALPGSRVRSRAWSRARGSSGACRRGPCRAPARSRPWRGDPEK